jgi:hypothetical protein
MEDNSPAAQFSRRALEADGMIKIESLCTACGVRLIGTRFGEPDLATVEANHARDCTRRRSAPAFGTGSAPVTAG